MADIVLVLVPVFILIFILSVIVMLISGLIVYFTKDPTTKNNAEDVFGVSKGISGLMLMGMIIFGGFAMIS